MAPRPELREQAAEAERDYAVKVSARFGFLCARVPGVPGAHWDADDGPGLRRLLPASLRRARQPGEAGQ